MEDANLPENIIQGAERRKKMEKIYALIPRPVLWAMESPDNLMIFWTAFVGIFCFSLLIINFFDEKRRKGGKK